MSRREARASDRQREAVRAELHDYVDRAVDRWPIIDKQAAEMGRGLHATQWDGSRSGGHGDPTVRTALRVEDDPALKAQEWQEGFRQVRALLRAVDARGAKLMPEAVHQGRVNTVDVCGLCKQPAPKVKRVDGRPYCAASCYYSVWRAGRTEGGCRRCGEAVGGRNKSGYCISCWNEWVERGRPDRLAFERGGVATPPGASPSP